MARTTLDGVPIEQVSPCLWRIPREARPDMRVDGLLVADEDILAGIEQDQALVQVMNVATLPGIQKASIALPDIHWGYGFPIGGVCATDPAEGGVVSPGGVGYDINCGVRLLRSDLEADDLSDRMEQLVRELFLTVPAGTGRGGTVVLDDRALDAVLAEGPRALAGRFEVTERDLERTEAHGRIPGADPAGVSARARERGRDQCGSLGSGNHFLEVQRVARIFDEETARVFGLFEGQVTVLIHSGSRGLGHQVCEDTLRRFRDLPERLGIRLPDRQLACAPIESEEGRTYLGAMAAAANFAFTNRQLLAHLVRRAFETVLGRPWSELGLEIVYDVAHNIAKFEEHDVYGARKRVLVHRKGATRAFPAGHPEIPDSLRSVGQPVLVPGDMGRASYVLVGQERAMEITFGTSCHGAGRRLSRKAAVKQAAGRRIDRELRKQGIVAMGHSRRGLAEEAPFAYKDVAEVVDVVERAGIARKVARLEPLGVIKG